MMFFDEADQALQEGVALDVVSLGAAVYALCPTWRAAQAVLRDLQGRDLEANAFVESSILAGLATGVQWQSSLLCFSQSGIWRDVSLGAAAWSPRCALPHMARRLAPGLRGGVHRTASLTLNRSFR
ncbi:unnamed protein product [Durusdinium trenchii]|uniref:Uncharacterized protein n=1 Tax=Durusdinium trenchii TaxID=1381693 RepID=A0ABP0PDY6_9DINO